MRTTAIKYHIIVTVITNDPDPTVDKDPADQVFQISDYPPSLSTYLPSKDRLTMIAQLITSYPMESTDPDALDTMTFGIITIGQSATTRRVSDMTFLGRPFVVFMTTKEFILDPSTDFKRCVK